MPAFRTLELSSPRLEHDGLRFVTVHSLHLRGRGDLTVWAPDAALGAAPLPLVILLHGVYGSHWAWAFLGAAHLTARRLIEEGRIPPMALAMPSDGLASDGTGYVNQSTADYERWILDDVPAAAAAALPAVEPGVRPFIAGLSMGGFGALRLGGRHPERFRGISAHSSVTRLEQLDGFLGEPFPDSMPVDDAAIADLFLRQRHRLPPVRFDCGTEDPLIEANRKLHLDLLEQGVAHGYQEFAGGHEWPYWERHLEDTLKFFGGILEKERPRDAGH